MKTLIWKIRYALEIRRLLDLPVRVCWDMAGSTVESLGDDIEIWGPIEAAEDEVEEWRNCC